MHACFFNMLHDPSNEHVAGIVAHRIHIDFDCVVEETVDQDRAVAGNFEHVARLHGDFERSFVRHDDHAAAAQHIRRA